jgi:dihydroflavonol-4-reductase
LSGDIGESNKAVQMVATGKMPVAVPLQFGYVDVRDVAAAHILAMQNPASSNGERFALAEKDLWYKDVAKTLRENGFDKAPTLVPVWLAKIMANFSKELKLRFLILVG